MSARSVEQDMIERTMESKPPSSLAKIGRTPGSHLVAYFKVFDDQVVLGLGSQQVGKQRGRAQLCFPLAASG